MDPSVGRLFVYLADGGRLQAKAVCPHGACQRHWSRIKRGYDFRQVDTLQQVRDEVCERVLIVFCLQDVLIRDQAASQIQATDVGIEGCGEQGRYGQWTHRRHEQVAPFQSGMRPNPGSNRKHIGHTLSEQWLAKDERGPGIVLFSVVSPRMPRIAPPDFGPKISDASDIGGTNRGALWRKVLAELVL